VKTIVASHNPDLAHDFDRDLLKRKDLRMVTARTIAELVERLHAGADVCFVDRVLPDGDGEMALATFRADKKLASIPVVLVSGSGAPASDRQRARELGFAELVELPAPPGALGLLVARLLGMPLREDERFAVRVHVFDAGTPAKDAGSPSDSYLGTSADLSENGMLLKARRDLPAGTKMGLRFSLPGRPGELNVRARVVRVDERSFAPARGLAIAFEDLTPADAGALHDYLRVLVGGRPFQWQVADHDGKKIVTFSGVLRGDSDLDPLRMLYGEVTFRMREFRRISSDSVQRWIDFVRGLKNVSRIHLVECPISFVHQANLITNLLERQDVRSFYAPYSCPRCGLDEEKLVDVAKDLEGGTRRTPPPFPCSACGSPLAFDDLVEQYFAFLDPRAA
jgi:CheY-like chemotaxis protein